MIFRDIRTGALLNIRKDEYNNDTAYYREIMRIARAGSDIAMREVLPYYNTTYDEIKSEEQKKQRLR